MPINCFLVSLSFLNCIGTHCSNKCKYSYEIFFIFTLPFYYEFLFYPSLLCRGIHTTLATFNRLGAVRCVPAESQKFTPSIFSSEHGSILYFRFSSSAPFFFLLLLFSFVLSFSFLFFSFFLSFLIFSSLLL